MTTRLLKVAGVLQGRFASPTLRRTLLLIASAGFIVGAILSVASLNIRFSEIAWSLLLVSALLGLVLIPLNAVEFQIAATISGHQVPIRTAARITLVASALNFLPIPAGVAYRVRQLTIEGSTVPGALRGSAFSAGVWLGIATLVAGTIVSTSASVAIGIAFFAVSAVIALGVGILARGLPSEKRAPLLLLTIAIECGFLLQASIRLLLILIALRETANFYDAAVMATGGALGTVIGIIPGGLGVWEATTAILANLVGVPASAGFLAAALLRLTGYLATATALAVAWGAGILGPKHDS